MQQFIRQDRTTVTRSASLFTPFLQALLGAALFITGAAAANTLQDISYSSGVGDTVQVTLQLAGPATEPLVFTVDNPARIALDLVDTDSTLANKSNKIGIGVLNGYSSATARGRTRVVLKLSQIPVYETRVNGNAIIVTLGGSKKQVIDTAASPVINITPGDKDIKNIDFRRGEKGEGLIQVTLPSAKTSVDMRQEADKLIIDFISTTLPQPLQRKLDVRDFATPVYEIDTFNNVGNTRMEIKLDERNEHLAYRSNEDFVVEVKPISDTSEEVAKRKGSKYIGEKLSLNFQDIEARSVLQLLADFTGLNVVVSDSVTGNLTLRLNNVPWDQALDIILKTKGLAQRQTGNVILIAPAAEIANAERLELEAAQQVRELAPLTAEFIGINYANAADIAAIISSEDNSLISERGSITVDPRTNTLLVRDTAAQISEIRSLIRVLDIPVRQVLIESRIVSASDDFSKSLGVRFGFSKAKTINSGPGDSPFAFNERSGEFPASYRIQGTQGGTFNLTGSDDETLPLLVNLPSSQAGASVGLAVGKLGSHILQLELSAMQTEGRGEVISSPRLVTADKTEAVIETGVQIPYQEASSSGATTTQFKDALLSLNVTPQITPDNRVIMDLIVSRDSPSEVRVGAEPAIDTQSVTTQVIVDNGETVVLGGVYQNRSSTAKSRVPFFSDLPYIGWAFRNSSNTANKTELLIFVTPKILKEKAQLN